MAHATIAARIGVRRALSQGAKPAPANATPCDIVGGGAAPSAPVESKHRCPIHQAPTERRPDHSVQRTCRVLSRDSDDGSASIELEEMRYQS
jgi:hypothetical protein